MKAIMCLGVLAFLVGCDGSRVQLESAKTDLANVTRERDDLKVQLATMQQQLNAVKADLAKEKTAEAMAAEKSGKGPMASKTSSGDSSASSKSKRNHKS
jgi:hypothetical protein